MTVIMSRRITRREGGMLNARPRSKVVGRVVRAITPHFRNFGWSPATGPPILILHRLSLRLIASVVIEARQNEVVLVGHRYAFAVGRASVG